MSKYLELESLPTRVFTIGDIHACIAELQVLLEHFSIQGNLSVDDLVIFIGDYIDRGQESSKVIDLILEFKKQFPKTIFLRGNHEDMFLAFLDNPNREGKRYLANGGKETLISYGVNIDRSYQEIFESLKEVLPSTHIEFYQSLEHYVISPEYVFVHAGINPLRDLRHQLESDLFWIRDEFIKNIHYFKRVVVFGHTPYEDVLVHLPYKIGIDTGLVYGNKLSCVELQGKQVLQVAKGGKEVKVREL